MADRFEYTVPGIRCDRCASSITEAVARVDGVSSVEVDGQEVLVRGALLSGRELTAAMLEAGFEAIG